MKTKISAFCIWRDSEKYIHSALETLESLANLKDFDFSFYFYENDSKDKTPDILEEWINKRHGGFLSEKLGAQKFGSTTDPQRMKLLCSCRNKCKSLAGKNESDFSLLFDSDIKFTVENFLTQISFLFQNTDAVMVTPNVRQNIPDLVFGDKDDSYYDVYPFRDKYGNDGMYCCDCPSFLHEDKIAWKFSKPIRVLSAFGGFAIVRSEIFNKVSWSSDVNCDHVNMCFDISRMGDIYILPYSRVYSHVETNKLNLENLKDIALRQRDIYEKYFT